MFDDLAYPQVWSIFNQIRKIPRPSFKEEAIRDYIYQWAEKHQFKIVEDQAHNLVVYVPATKGYEDAEIIATQGHLDMVCEKHADVDFNFETDAINIKRDGDWIKADGTTLGADNGIGVALAMASATDPEIIHGPMELLFTATEEQGLVGARNLETRLLNARYMINIDSESFGEFTIGCSGGGDTVIELPIETISANKNAYATELKVSGLKGGHSGIDIHKNRGNALKILGRILKILPSITLASFEGGNLRNAIPREAKAIILTDTRLTDDELTLINDTFKSIQSELKDIEPKLDLTISSITEMPNDCFDKTSQNKLIGLIESLPHGVVAMDEDMPDLVETSSNLASVTKKDKILIITQSTRSSIMAKLEAQREYITRTAQKFGGKAISDEAYPGWKPNPNSSIVAKSTEVFKETFSFDAHVTAIHAGLECGIINGKYPHMEMISFGPDIRGAHSPDERLDIPSTIKCYDLLKNLLKALSTEKRKSTKTQANLTTA